jgi:integrase
MATVRKRGERWQVIVQVRRPDGTRTSNAATFDTEDEARLHAHRLEYAVRSGELGTNRSTVAEVADTWLTLQRHTHHATLDAYRHAIARAVRALGRVQARQLTTQQCDIAWAQMLDTHAPSSVRQTRGALSTCMEWAAVAGIIAANPVKASKVRAQPDIEIDDTQILTAAELDRVLQWIGPSPWPTMWRLLADTGLRQGEARVLRWRDLDLDGRRLKVTATATRSTSGERVGAPKTRHSRRTVPLTAAATSALRRHRSAQAERYGVAFVAPGAHVFTRTGGEFTGGRQLVKWWHRCCDDVGVVAMTPHNLRHTYASVLLNKGVPLVKVAALLGHTPAVCAATYAHFIDDNDDSAAAIIERARQM